MLPDPRDLAALPTSWALTIWDALPVFLSVEIALVVAISVLVRPGERRTVWTISGLYLAGGAVYLWLFDTRLMLTLLAIAIACITAVVLRADPVVEVAPPPTPSAAIWQRGGDLVWSVMKASAAAAVLKIFLGPSISESSLAWISIAVAGGIIAPGPLGIAAIPALAMWSASNSIWPPALWIASAAVRPYLLKRIQRAKNAEQRPTGSA